jgi:hypothetical protein
MRKKIIFLVVSTMLLVNTAVAFSVNTGNKNLFVAQTYQADVPTWEQGDFWTYDVEILGNISTSTQFDLDVNELTFTVSQVMSDRYKITIDAPTGTVSGQVSVTDPISVSGSITNAGIDGTLYVNKSDLTWRNDEGFTPQATLTGKVGIANIQATLDVDIAESFSSLNFPLSVGKEWASPENLFTIHYDAQVGPIHINDQSDPDDAFYPLWAVIPAHNMTVATQDIVNVPFGTFKDSYKIQWVTDSNQYVWYSPDAKNIVKADFQDLNAYIFFQHLSFELIDSSYLPPNDPPEAPGAPSGETNGYAYVEYEYEASSTDPDNNQIKYGFDWEGDGTVDDWSELVDSGQTGSASHAYTTAGTYQIKVKAQDTRGAESDWSTALTVTINENSPPEKPDTPDGPTSGSDDTTYTYTSKTTDADGNQIYYMFDWGDGTDSGWLGPYDSDVQVSDDHAWNNRGDYSIKVRAKDEHGALSEWSDPLSVSMPKYKFKLRLVLEDHPILERLLLRIFSRIFSI